MILGINNFLISGRFLDFGERNSGIMQGERIEGNEY